MTETKRLPQGRCVQCRKNPIQGIWMLCRACRKNPRPITYGMTQLGTPIKKIKETVLYRCEKLGCPALIKRGKYCMAHADEPHKQAMRRAAQKRKERENAKKGLLLQMP